MAVENFTTYTEVDPNSRISKTATKVTWTLLTRDEDAYVYLDKDADYFNGDFTIYLTHRTTAVSASGTRVLGCWSLTNTIDDLWGIYVANGDWLAVLAGQTLGGAGAPTLWLVECDGGSQYGSPANPYEIALNTDYYLTVIRDESVGTYGTLYLYIYSDASRTTLLDTQTLTLHAKVDFRYIYAIQTQDTDTATLTHSGYTENLELFLAPTVTTQAMTSIITTTATGNGNVTDLGDPAATQHGHCWNTTGTPTTSDDKTANGVPSATGAFTSSLTGLTSGTLYYVRAYVTNAIGTSYGGEVNFIAGASEAGELRGVIAVVEERLHYLDAYGVERYIEGALV